VRIESLASGEASRLIPSKAVKGWLFAARLNPCPS
jgi:hypothetical protein